MTAFQLPPVTTECIDVAYPQQDIDWAQVKKNKIDFAWIKATERDYRDAYFFRNWEEAQKNDVQVGAYHFFRIRADAEAQAAWFVDVVGRQAAEHLPLCIDFEEDFESAKSTLKEFSSRDRCRALLRCAQAVERFSGKKPILYTGAFILGSDTSLADELRGFPLWLAQYTSTIRWLPSQWSAPTLWQYSGNGGKRLEGINVDVDRNKFMGSAEDLVAWNQEMSTGKKPEYPFSTVFGVQRALEQLGYNPGGLDGKWGKNTRASLQKFIQDTGLPFYADQQAFSEVFSPIVKEHLGNVLHASTSEPMCTATIIDMAAYAAWKFRTFFYGATESEESVICNEDGMCAGDVADTDQAA